MAALKPIYWTDLRGMNAADPATMLGPNGATDMHNVLIEPLSLGRERPSLDSISLTSGPTVSVQQLARFQPADDSGDAELFAFTSGTNLHHWDLSAWSSVTVTDTPVQFSTARPYAVTHNGKLYVAYNSSVNRLHVYDPNTSTSTLRRVGIEASAAPSVADTGSGSYAATIRYYKVQWKLKNGSNVIATSELSAAQTFTPSGSGTAARVTKPTTPDSATHWVVFGSSDNVTFYNISGDIAVGTTTYDDSEAPSAYSDGDVAETAGLRVPPPSAKYLLSDGNRLLMAGCWETTATSTQTATRNSRVWFTQVNGALDNTGEDEAIAQTVDQRNWVDCGENDGDAIVGLAGPLDGAVYVFKSRSIWALTPTGIPSAPYRSDRVTSALGATWQDAITMGEDGNGNPSIYFMAITGPKRISRGRGIEDIGGDVRAFPGLLLSVSEQQYTLVHHKAMLVWDIPRRVLWWFGHDESNDYESYAFQPQFESHVGNGSVRGGWTRHTLRDTGDIITARSAVLFETSGGSMAPYVGGAMFTAYLGSLNGQDESGASVTSGVLRPAGPATKFTCQSPILEYEINSNLDAVYSVTLASVINGATSVLGSQTDSSGELPSGTTSDTTVAIAKCEGIQLSDIDGVQLTVAWPTTQGDFEASRVISLTVPVISQEPV